MKYITAKEQKLSMFSLGTVQLGMNYGIGEDRAKPSEEKAFALLDRAMELGVDNLDTANNYGDSEAVIGRWLQKRKAEGKKCPWVVTKIGPLKHGSFDIVRDDILRQTEGCQKTLGVDTIDCLMLHNYEDYADDRDNVRKVFEELKAQKAYRYSAISAYSEHDYGVIADSGFDATQIPMNVFDWVKINDGEMEKLEKSGMMVFVRSVFLQGLVFHTPESLDPRLDFCLPYLEKYCGFCKEFGLSPAVLALSFVQSVPGVTTTVLGCDNVAQLESNCQLFDQTVKLTDEQMKLLHDAFTGIDPRVINPRVWFKK
ncbi:MAG: aldo/keto reductase [Oscillospiraceae bacterium]|nr:aldo/keto reductase [Oscillospiraceae bacterium]